MKDTVTTVAEIKEAVHEMCIQKGWGVDGVQNPQHVAMAMSVEMGEFLEHFAWLNPEDVEGLLRGDDPERLDKIGEEFADVMMYGMQLMRCLNIDVAAQMEKKIGIVLARKYPRKDRLLRVKSE